MRSSRFSLVAIFILLFSIAVIADGHRAGLFSAYSEEYASTLHGVYFSFDGSPHKSGTKAKPYSVIGDFSVHHGTHNGEKVTRTFVSGGINVGKGWRAPKGQGARGDLKMNVVNFHYLLGVAHGESGTAFGNAPGISYDFTLEPGGKGWKALTFRVQYDHLIRASGLKDSDRLSIGIAKKWY